MADCTGVFLLGKSSNMNSCKICLGRSRETKIAWWNVGRKEQKTSVCVVGGGGTRGCLYIQGKSSGTCYHW